MKTTAKDFFLNLGIFASFYASVVALIALLFETINYAYPQITNAYYYYSPSIGFQVATLVVAFPIFLWLTSILRKTYAKDPELKGGWVRRWLSYITLFVAGAVVAGDLITVIYMYLDGQDLTAGFLLKVLALLVIAGGVFFYYLREIKGVIERNERVWWRGFSAALVVFAIVLGFTVIGSPADQRAYRLDNERVNNLQNIQWEIVNYWQQKGALPATLEDLRDPLKNNYLPTDPKTEENYTYNRNGNLSFSLCAEFARESGQMMARGVSIARPEMRDMMVIGAENWQHEAGMHCFDRTIDPDLYPVRPR